MSDYNNQILTVKVNVSQLITGLELNQIVESRINNFTGGNIKHSIKSINIVGINADELLVIILLDDIDF